MKRLHLITSNFIFINLLFLSTVIASHSDTHTLSNQLNFNNIYSSNTISKIFKDTCLLGDCVSGYGVLLTTKNQKIVGNFRNRKLEGYGVIQYGTGSVFIGHFNNGLRDGEGQLKHPHKVIKGIWAKDRYLKSAPVKIEGCKSGNCNNGIGVYVYQNSTVFMGGFYEGRARGNGICFFHDGDVYYGQWENHNFHGKGSYLYGEALTIQNGFWNKGQYLNDRIKLPQISEDKVEVTQEDNGKSEIWAVIVGVAQYRHMQALRYTDDDAYAMNAFLRSPEGGAVRKSNVKVLIDEAATKKNIINALNDFAEKADKNDVFIFYFSGHGLPESLLPIDYDGSNNKLHHKDLVKIFKSSDAKSKVVIADACYSGNMLAFKGEDYQTSMNNYYNEIRKNEGGLVMIMSSKAEETSIENNGLRQGIFSHFLMRGLYGAANTNNDNLIRLDELFEYVQKNVSFYTNNYQTPMIYGNKSIDLPIAVIRE